jgi:putative membrane protein
MRFKWLNETWQGVILGLGLIVVTLWLGLVGKLNLYIHPRYILFTVIMSALGLLIILAGFWRQAFKSQFARRTSFVGLLAGVACAVVVAGMLVTKPAALTSSTAQQRGINAAAIDSATQSYGMPLTLPSSTDYERFSIKEWASLLSQSNDPGLFTGKAVDLSGFVSPAGNNRDVFYVSRFVVSCCAVDARPLGVPVRVQNWRQSYRADQWIQVKGEFIAQPNGDIAIVVKPDTITNIKQPDDPYAY